MNITRDTLTMNNRIQYYERTPNHDALGKKDAQYKYSKFIYFQSRNHYDQRQLKPGTIYTTRCRMHYVVHKTSRKMFKFVNYELKMKVVEYNPRTHFLMSKIIDFCPYEFINDFYINQYGQKIHYEPFVYGSLNQSYSECVDKILYIPPDFDSKSINLIEKMEMEPYKTKTQIAEDIKRGIQTRISDYYQQVHDDSRLGQVKNKMENTTVDDILIKKRKSLDENDELNIVSPNFDNTFIDKFMEQSKLSTPKSKKMGLVTSSPEKNQGKSIKDVKLLYQQLLLKHAR